MNSACGVSETVYRDGRLFGSAPGFIRRLAGCAGIAVLAATLTTSADAAVIQYDAGVFGGFEGGGPLEYRTASTHIALQKFDPSLGILNSVTMSFSGWFMPIFRAKADVSTWPVDAYKSGAWVPFDASLRVSMAAAGFSYLYDSYETSHWCCTTGGLVGPGNYGEIVRISDYTENYVDYWNSWVIEPGLSRIVLSDTATDYTPDSSYVGSGQFETDFNMTGFNDARLNGPFHDGQLQTTVFQHYDPDGSYNEGAWRYSGTVSVLYNYTSIAEQQSVPEPESLALMAAGLFGVVAVRRRQRLSRQFRE